MHGRLEQVGQQLDHPVPLAVVGHAGHADGGVVRPDRAVVIGHRIEARLAHGQGADAPAAVEGGREQLFGDPLGPFRRRQAAEQQVPRVGRAHSAQLAGAVDGDAIAAEVFHPEAPFDRLAQLFGPRPPARGGDAVASPFGETGHLAIGGEGVALHLDQGHRALREASVGVEDGVGAVLPALVGQAALLALLVVDEAVGV